MFFTPIFSFLEKFEPYTKAVSSALGMITNYRQNKKIESVENDISKIKSILGLKEVKLNENELKVLSLFIKKAEEKDYATHLISIDYSEFNELDISGDLDDVLITLESYRFLDVQRFLNGGAHYKLNFITYINSNLIQSIFSESITYSELFRLVVNYIYENHRKEDIIYTNQLIEELTLNIFLLNPILYHLDLIGVIKLSKTLGNTKIVASHSLLIKPKLYELYRELNEDEE